MRKNSWIFILYFFVFTILSIIHFSTDPDFTFIHIAVNLTAIIGIVSIFFAILVTLLKKKIMQNISISIRTLHHFFSYIGWTCILIHLVSLYFEINDFSIYMPSFLSWEKILEKSGPIAFLLILLGGLGILYMKHWKTFLTIHSVNVIALIWISMHAVIKVDALSNNLTYVIYLLTMDLIVLGIAIYNYLSSNKRKVA
jgi:hypothetical protein